MKWAILLLVTAVSLRADLSAVMAEDNLEKRSELALKHAEQLLKTTRSAYDAGDMESVKRQLNEMKEAVTRSLDSLLDTKKNPRKKSKYFKKAEIKTRQLMRDVEDLSEAMSVVDRPLCEPLASELGRVNDALVRGILGIKPRKELKR